MAKHMQVLKRLLGRDNTDETLATLAEAVKKLDKAGVTRKQGEGEAAADESGANTMLDALDSVGASDIAGLVAGILKVIDELGGTESLDTAAGGHAELVAKLIQAVTAGGPAAEPETMAEDEQNPMMTEEMLKDSASMKSIVKALADYSVHSIEDMGELAKAQLALTESVHGLIGKMETLDELSGRLKSIEDLFAARPRSATKSSVTIVRSVDRDGEEDLDEVKKEMAGQEQVSVLGLKVPKRKDATYK